MIRKYGTVDLVLSYRFTSKNGEIVCEGISGIEAVFNFSEKELNEKADMFYRHDELKKSYVEGDVWQFICRLGGEWQSLVGEPNWSSTNYYDHRIHPLNEFIKAHNAGETVMWQDAVVGESFGWDHPKWKPEDFTIVQKPKTKTVYEWMWRENCNWYVNAKLVTEQEAYEQYEGLDYKKTGRSWEVEV